MGTHRTIARMAGMALVGIGVALLATGAAAVPAQAAHRAPASALAGWHLYVDDASGAARSAASLARQGDSADAGAVSKIASRPTATWITSSDGLAQVGDTVAAAASKHRQPVFVAYDMVGRDCGSYSAGGATSPADYRAWIGSFARRLGARRAVVILEPDAIPQALTCASATASTRYSLLSYAVRTLARHPGTRVYLDAGNSSWITDTSAVAGALRRADIARADGFSLNVSNFETTRASTAYGTAISKLLGGKHFVIDTGRNGNGPYTGSDGPTWCNPPGRALGHVPTTSTPNPRVDAYLWIKPPGESDGSCRLGEPASGTFWTDYAVGLVRNAH